MKSEMSSNPPNYKDLYFEYKVLTRINGEPDFASLHHLLLQLKANAISVPCHIGGGAHGFVGIILLLATYATLTTFTPFVIPLHPGLLVHLQGTTQCEIAASMTPHNEYLLTFHSHQLVQRALVQQVLEVLDTKYLATLRNRITGQVPVDIISSILHLFRIYGKMTPLQLRTRYDLVETIKCKIEEPIDIIFDAIEDLVEIGKLVGRSFTP